MSNTPRTQNSMRETPFDLLFAGRVIWLNDEVSDETMLEISSKLLILSAEDSKADIYMIINSPGGSITSGLMMMDIIDSIPNDVVTIGMGMCASMGQVFLTMGADGKRFITKGARVMLHQPHGGFHGTQTDITTSANLINDMKTQLASITAAKTGKSIEQIHEDGDRDRWFRAEEALEYGFVDHIVENILDVIPISKTVQKSKKAREASEKHLQAVRKLELQRLENNTDTESK